MIMKQKFKQASAFPEYHAQPWTGFRTKYDLDLAAKFNPCGEPDYLPGTVAPTAFWKRSRDITGPESNFFPGGGAMPSPTPGPMPPRPGPMPMPRPRPGPMPMPRPRPGPMPMLRPRPGPMPMPRPRPSSPGRRVPPSSPGRRVPPSSPGRRMPPSSPGRRMPPSSPMARPSPAASGTGRPKIITCPDGRKTTCNSGTRDCMDNSPVYCK